MDKPMTWSPSIPAPMLAKAGKLEDLDGAVERGYMIEPKLDGIRCIVIADRQSIQLYNRQLRNITPSFPDVVDEIRRNVYVGYPLGGVCLDGEIYVNGADGVPDFQLVQTRANRIRDVLHAAHDYPAHFQAFDVLKTPYFEYYHQAQVLRRRLLEEIAPTLVVPQYTQADANRRAEHQIGEGLMLKHMSSTYTPGYRNPAWLKVKWLREVECYVGGVTWGTGKREGYFGGLLVGVFLPGDSHGQARLEYIGTVGTGFTDAVLAELRTKLDALRTTANPFADRSDDWDLEYFVQPVLRAKVRFAEYTRDGIMRFPRWVGLVE